MSETIEAFFSLLRFEFTQAGLEDVVQNCAEDGLQELLSFARAHDMAHLISDALCKSGILTQGHPLYDGAQKDVLRAVWSTTNLNKVFLEICRCFDQNEISYIPLKGSVLRGEYPKPWMRTSCDVDILIHPEDLERASAALQKIGFIPGRKKQYDMNFRRGQFLHLELHFRLIGKEPVAGVAAILDRVWEYAVQAEGSRYDLPDPFFYFYQLAHLAKHCANSGCGVRPFLDLWILEQRPHDEQLRTALIEEGGLQKFRESAEELMKYWMQGGTADPVIESFSQYILSCGVFGNKSNRLTARLTRTKKTSYIFSRIFMPYRSLKICYPILEKWPVLLPAAEVKRWGDLLFHKNRRARIRAEFRKAASVSDTRMNEMKRLMEQIGL